LHYPPLILRVEDIRKSEPADQRQDAGTGATVEMNFVKMSAAEITFRRLLVLAVLIVLARCASSF